MSASSSAVARLTADNQHHCEPVNRADRTLPAAPHKSPLTPTSSTHARVPLQPGPRRYLDVQCRPRGLFGSTPDLYNPLVTCVVNHDANGGVLQMRVTGLGHAGLLIETRTSRILCDPWVNPAYFQSWYPCPDNRELDWGSVTEVDYLYISHRHQDHLDKELLASYVHPSTPVLLPDYPLTTLRKTLTSLGFTNQITPPAGAPFPIGGDRILINPQIGPSDGPIGDSTLSVSDGTATILNQNDTHLTNLSSIRSFGPYTAHFLQHTGALWWPMVYDLPLKAKQHFALLKRKSQRTRALRYARDIEASHVFPFAGPPMFLDPDLIGYNGTGDRGESIFEDPDVFLDLLRDETSTTQGHRFFPGTVVDMDDDSVTVTQSLYPEEQINRISRDWGAYRREQILLRQRPLAETEHAGHTSTCTNHTVLPALIDWIEPLMRAAPSVCEAINGALEISIQDERVLFDFPARTIRAARADKTPYRFTLPHTLVCSVITDREPDWCNSIFLSLRFKASRVGKFNQALYAFFSSLDNERMEYVESWYAKRDDTNATFTAGGWTIQRRCPHAGADLSQTGSISGNTLTCRVHGWQFDLETGRCIAGGAAEIDATKAVTVLPDANNA